MIQRAKGKADAKPKTKAKGREKSKGKGSGKEMTAEEKKLVPCRQFQIADGCRFGDACVFKHEGVKPGGCATETILLDTEPCDYNIGCAATDADNKRNQHPSQSSNSTSSSSTSGTIPPAEQNESNGTP